MVALAFLSSVVIIAVAIYIRCILKSNHSQSCNRLQNHPYELLNITNVFVGILARLAKTAARRFIRLAISYIVGVVGLTSWYAPEVWVVVGHVIYCRLADRSFGGSCLSSSDFSG